MAPPESLIEVDLVAVSPKPIGKFPKCEMVTGPRNMGNNAGRVTQVP
ncbi:hypothetical protein [uncultured Actinomyces sp.]|nr:hypothetical protein [uncultured Actinomyces sp.]